MQRQHYRHPRGPSHRRPGLSPFGRDGLLKNLLIGGVGYLIGRQQFQSSSTTHSDQLAQLRLLGQLRESGVLTEEEFQEQKQKILHQS
jgi:hypothetical protein